MSTIATPDVLAKVPLLAGLNRKSLVQLSRELKDRSFRAGDYALKEGESGVGFFIVLEGTARVTVGDHEAKSMGPGDWFGEIALLAPDRVRTASVIAQTDLHCVGLTEWEFRPFLAEHPDVAWQIMQTMARRIADQPS